MKKINKFFLSFLIVTVLSFTNIYAMGAGIEFYFTPTFNFSNKANIIDIDVSTKGTVKCSKYPIVYGAGISITNLTKDITLGTYYFFDYWLLDKQIKNNFNIYSGLGFSNNFTFKFSNIFNDILGARAFVGLNWFFLDNYIELYIQQNVAPGVNFNISRGGLSFELATPVETGLRWHF